jgi:RimJ/RimL family protein N-acetyltransferase
MIPAMDLRPTLEGRIVRLEPLEARHQEGLWTAAADPRIWRLLPWNAAADRAAFARWAADALERSADGSESAFCVLTRSDGVPQGSTRYLNVRPDHGVVEIGWTWLSPDAWGTGANAEAKLLLMEHAFERLGCMRVEFKTDALNERARAALESVGAQFEGVARKHMLVRDGVVRDSAWYAVVDDDWPEVRARLSARVADKAGAAA